MSEGTETTPDDVHCEGLVAYVANTPLRRVGDPVDDVGEGVVFLCGPQSRYVTGTTLMLDGGRSYLR